MRISIIVVGAVIMVVGIVLIPTSRLVSETSSKWEYHGVRDVGGASFSPQYIYLYPDQRWTLEITYYAGDSPPSLPSNLTITLSDYQGNLVYSVPYSVLKGMPHGWEPVSVEGNYTLRIVRLDEWLGIEASYGYWAKETQTIYPLESWLQIGIALLIGGAIITSIGAFLKRK